MNRRNLFKALAGLAALPLTATAKSTKQKRLLQQSPIAGFQYYQGEKLWSQFQIGQPLTLQREAHNTYDKRAVALYWYEHKLGYIPRRDNAAISQLMDRNQPLSAVIEQLHKSDDNWKRMRIAVNLD